jgi:hypothetical protein
MAFLVTPCRGKLGRALDGFLIDPPRQEEVKMRRTKAKTSEMSWRVMGKVPICECEKYVEIGGDNDTYTKSPPRSG